MSMNAPLQEHYLNRQAHGTTSFDIGQHEPTAQHKVVLQ